jgi:hypothetical protein
MTTFDPDTQLQDLAYSKKSCGNSKPEAPARERLRKRYRPAQVRILFVGESPPASGRFFYQADSGLYRAIHEAFVSALPALRDADFLESFRGLGCYLVDLCAQPVDRMGRKQRSQACRDGEVRLSRMIKQLQPEIIITVVRSVAPNIKRAQYGAKWSGEYFELPYPGRWRDHRVAFVNVLIPVLLRMFQKP